MTQSRIVVRDVAETDLEVVVDSAGPSTRGRLIRQDLCFLVSILLLFAMIGAALTGLAGDEDEFFGIGDDLHMRNAGCAALSAWAA
jgi:hypothetical protein